MFRRANEGHNIASGLHELIGDATKSKMFCRLKFSIAQPQALNGEKSLPSNSPQLISLSVDARYTPEQGF